MKINDARVGAMTTDDVTACATCGHGEGRHSEMSGHCNYGLRFGESDCRCDAYDREHPRQFVDTLTSADAWRRAHSAAVAEVERLRLALDRESATGDDAVLRADALAAENARLRAALTHIQRWDCLNPPRGDLLADLPWLARLVDAALATTEPGEGS